MTDTQELIEALYNDLVRVTRERDQYAAVIAEARSYYGVNEAAYVVKVLDSVAVKILNPHRPTEVPNDES